MRTLLNPFILLTTLVALTSVQAQEVRIRVQADSAIGPVSRFLTGACIEDVNHEQYGGIDSQMVFGESFAEPPPQPPLSGFSIFGGKWTVGSENSLQVQGSDGAKIVWDGPTFSEGEASVDVWLTETGGGNGGFILKVSDPAKGADKFNGYEVALERPGTLVLGRHRQNWEPLRRVPCAVPVNQWITLTVRMTAKTLEVLVNGRSLTQYEDTEHPLETGKVGLRTWQHDVRFRNLSVTTGGEQRKIPFALAPERAWGDGVSGMWRALRRGNASGEFAIDERNAFSGRQSQRITFTGGQGEIGIENQSLNRWGMNFVQGKTYEGFVCVRAEQPTELFVALESRDGAKVYAEKRLKAVGRPDDSRIPLTRPPGTLSPTGGEGRGEGARSMESGWQKLSLSLKPDTADKAGRFAIKLKKPGSVTVGYAFLQPGEWGRFKGLPVRKDVAEGLIDQGITVLRQGGCMVNAAEYRWKKMIGPREQRPPYVGWWYPHSSNGWGIFDFLNFCEAAGFLAIPDVNMGETPQDMADFIEYVNGPKDGEWGRQRAADGHPAPYRLKYLQLGNEEQVNEEYWQKFKPMAEAIWARDPDIILVVGDFAYGQKIEDPFNFKGAAGRITTLAAQQKILRLAQQHHREVWFDVHIGTDGPRPDFGGTLSYIDALAKIADGAKHRVVIFEFNAGNHSQRRALANAAAINLVERDGRIPIATSANCLQPDGQNDNDWNQGLLFLNPSQVWLQPPGYVTQMFSRNYLPQLVTCQVTGAAHPLDANAKRSANGKTLVLQVVNPSAQPVAAQIDLAGFVPGKPLAQVTELAGPLNAVNTADKPDALVPQPSAWRHDLKQGNARRTFPPHSFTLLRFE